MLSRTAEECRTFDDGEAHALGLGKWTPDPSVYTMSHQLTYEVCSGIGQHALALFVVLGDGLLEKPGARSKLAMGFKVDGICLSKKNVVLGQIDQYDLQLIIFCLWYGRRRAPPTHMFWPTPARSTIQVMLYLLDVEQGPTLETMSSWKIGTVYHQTWDKHVST